MRALFLAPFAATNAERIVAKLETHPTIEVLEDHRDKAWLMSALAEADIVVTQPWRAGFPPAPRLKLLQSVSAGIDQIDPDAVPPGVSVCNVFGHEPAIAEYVIMTMLVWAHRFVEITTSFRADSSWRLSGMQNGPPHGELSGRTIGIVGFGRIGRDIARRAAPFGVRILAVNRSPVAATDGVEAILPFDALDRMLPDCDAVVVCCGLAPETRSLIDRRRLALMKRDALLINVARGPIVDEDSLFAALTDGIIGGAAIDAWWQYPTAEEPDRRGSRLPFHELPNVIMTPHCSGWTEGMVDRRWTEVARNIDRAVRGEPLTNIVLAT